MICLTKLAKECEIDAAAIAQADIVLVKLPSGKLVTKAEYLATREGPTSREIVYGAVRAMPPPAPRGGEVDGVALSNSDAFLAVCEKRALSKGISMLRAAREELATWTGPAAPAPAPSPTPNAADLFNDDAGVALAEKRSIERGISILDAAREILRDRELDRRIAAAKK